MNKWDHAATNAKHGIKGDFAGRALFVCLGGVKFAVEFNLFDEPLIVRRQKIKVTKGRGHPGYMLLWSKFDGVEPNTLAASVIERARRTPAVEGECQPNTARRLVGGYTGRLHRDGNATDFVDGKKV